MLKRLVVIFRLIVLHPSLKNYVMPEKIGDRIIYCYTTGKYKYADGDDDSDENYVVEKFNVKYKNKLYRTKSVVEMYLKVMELIDKGATDNIQFDDIKLMRLFIKLFEIENEGMWFVPSKNRVPHYLSNVVGEMRKEKGILQIWAKGDPIIETSFKNGEVVTVSRQNGKVLNVTRKKTG